MQRKSGKQVRLKMLKFIIVTLVIITLISSDFLVVGHEVVATAFESSFNTQTEDTINKNVKFDTFFKEGNEKTHYLVHDVNGQLSDMYIDLSVRDGYLKDAVIEFEGQNYFISNIVDEKEIIQSASNDKLTLKQVNNLSSSLVLNIGTKISEKTSLDDLDKDCKVILKGVYVDSKGKEISIEKTIDLNIKLKQENIVELVQNINSYFAFQKDGKNKLLVRVDAKLNLQKSENGNLPVEKTTLTVELPKLNTILPESVSILPKNTSMTNGKTEEKVAYSSDQFEYDKDTNMAKVTLTNDVIDNKVWTGNENDEFYINYIYSQEDINKIQPLNMELNSKILASVKMYNSDEPILAESSSTYMLNEKLGEILSAKITTDTLNLSKGKMYANSIIADKKYVTDYNWNVAIDIATKEIQDGIIIDDNSEYFMDANNNAYNFNSYYTQTKINKQNFEYILCSEGYINIYNKLGNLVATINSKTTQDENGYYIVNYAEKNNSLRMETSKPINDGIIYLNNNKAISEEQIYTKTDLQKFAKLVNKMSVSKASDKASVAYATCEINLLETTTNANIVLNKDVLSTIVTNEDVEMKIELDNNREETDLYVNPVFLVELPEYIEDINVKEANILFDENLQISEIKKIIENGKIFLQVTLSGTQDGFSTGSFTNGTNIVLNTDIKAKLLTPNKNDEIKLYFNNQNAISYSNAVSMGEQVLGASSTAIGFSAPAEMIAVSSISNYEKTGKNIMSVNQGTVTDKIAINSESIIAKMQVMMVNNTGNTCDNIIGLGRIPFKGNKNIESNTELGTTKDAVLKSLITIDGIDADKITIYYSENGEATEDINDSNNAWTTMPTDLAKVKSYLVVLNNYEMQTGENIKFNYDFEIPEKLEHENSFYGAFGIYFTNKTSVGDKNENVIADTVGLTTGDGPKLSIDQACSAGDGNVIQEGQYVKFTIKITNTGSSNIEDAVIKNYIPDYTRYAVYQEGQGDYGEMKSGYIYPEPKVDENNKKYIEIAVGNIGVGESVTKEIELYVEKLPSFIKYYENNKGFIYDEETQKYYIVETNENDEILSQVEVTGLPEIKLINKVEVYAKDLETPYTNESKGNVIEKSSFLITEKANIDKNVVLTEGQEVSYYIDVENISGNKLSNVYIEKVLPVGLKYKEAYIVKYDPNTKDWYNTTSAVYSTETGKMFWSIGDMEADSTVRVRFVGITSNIESGKTEQEIKTKSIVYADGIGKHNSTDTVNIVSKPNLEVSITSDATKKYIAEGDKITYNIKIKNTGKILASNVKIQDALPSLLKFIKGSYKVTSTSNVADGLLKEQNNNVTFGANILPGDEILITIEAEAKNLPNNVDEKEIINFATLTGENIQEIKTEELVNIIEQSPTKPNPPTDDSNNTNNGNNSSGGNNQGGNSGTEKTFKIRGTAWLDANQNGARDNDESTMAGIKVTLVNAHTGEIIKDKSTGDLKQTTTGQDGSYVFENLEKGEYIVIFYYDNQIYAVTDYMKSGVSEDKNSDVISSKITENGTELDVAVTNTIKLSTSSYANIDVGLIVTKKFDLKLDKTINKITVQNKEGVKSYNFDNTTMAQVPITGKRLVGSVIITEYKIKVTNEGNVPGYAKNIVDYLPKEMKFNSDLNSNWYAGNDGYLYNTELANTVINPGESKEIALILTKQVTESNTVIVNNLAEIAEDYNELGIKDFDSTVKNQAQNEDDLGSANMIITVRTGATVAYIGMTLIGLVVAGCIIYIIRKRNAKYYN